MGDENGQQNRPRPLGDTKTKRQFQRRDDQEKHQNLTEFNTKVEREQGCQEMRTRELQALLQRE